MEKYYECEECGENHELIHDDETCPSCGHDSFDTIYVCECGEEYYECEVDAFKKERCTECQRILET